MITDLDLLRLALDPPDGEPETLRAAQRRVRDALLIQAARLIDGPPGERGTRLCEAARKFEVRKWGRWRHYDRPPLGADALDLLFWRALRCGLSLHQHPRTYEKLLSGENREFDR